MEMKQNCFLPETLQNRCFENYPVRKKKKKEREEKRERKKKEHLFIPPLLSTPRDILFCIVNMLQSPNSWQIFGWSLKGLDLLCPAVRHAIQSKKKLSFANED